MKVPFLRRRQAGAGRILTHEKKTLKNPFFTNPEADKVCAKASVVSVRT
jgi:hypothetical protein